MAPLKKYSKLLNELILSIAIMMGFVIGWYLLIYQPLISKSANLKNEMASGQDSLEITEKYKAMKLGLDKQIVELNEEIKEWDSRFPPRSSLVEITRQLISFCDNNGLRLIDMQPSLFKLYAMERAGNRVAGRYLYKQLFNLKLRGRYKNLGRMLKNMNELPFNVTVSDLKLKVIPDSRPELDIDLNMFLYVRQ